MSDISQYVYQTGRRNKPNEIYIFLKLLVTSKSKLWVTIASIVKWISTKNNHLFLPIFLKGQQNVKERWFLGCCYTSVNCCPSDNITIVFTAQKMKFSIKDFFSKYDQICRKLRIWSHLLKKSLTENFIFCAMFCKNITLISSKHIVI